MRASKHFTINVRTAPSTVPDICRLRRYLKALGRRMGLIVTEVKEVAVSTKSDPPAATKRREKQAKERADEAKPSGGHGGSRKPVQVDDINLNKGGTSADYLTARIARDRPDILEGGGK